MADYIPRADGKAMDWFTAFKTGTSSDHGQFMLSSSDAQLIASVVDAFASAHAVANNPATRNAVTIERKLAARVDAEKVCRLFAQLIKLNHGISNDSKLGLGVPTINNTKSKVACPLASPALSVVAATPLAHTLSYRDSMNPTKRAKPHGAQALQLFLTVDEHNASDPSAAKFAGNFASNPMAVTFDGKDRGKQATYFARWSGRRNQVGMWSLPISMTIAA